MSSSSMSVIELQEFKLDIHHFVEENNLIALQNFLVDPDLTNKRNSLNQTALHVACERGNLDIVQLLVERGANITARDVDEFTPLISASKAGHCDVVRFLVTKRSNIESVDKNGWPSVMWASYKGHTDVVGFLLNEGANIHTSVCYNMTCLLWAAGRGHDAIVKMLCSKGAQVNYTDKFGNTPLLWASRCGAVLSVRCLMQHHADPNVLGSSGSSCLLMAMKGEHLECASALLESPRLNINQADREGHTALSLAAKFGYDDIILELLDRGAFLNIADHHGDTALIKATKHGHHTSVKIILSKFADIDSKGKGNKTALHIACETGNVPIVKELLACSPNLESKNSDEESALVRAVKQGNLVMTKLLLDKGAEVSSVDKNHDTAIHCAVRSKNIPILELLLRNPHNARHLYRLNKYGESVYDIDNSNKKPVLPTLFGLKGYSASAIEQSSIHDVYSSAIADMLTDPGFETPLCIGLFAKWGSSVSSLLDNIKSQIGLFVGHPPSKQYRFSWITFFIVTFLSVFFGLVLGYLYPENAAVGIVTALTVLALPYLAIFVFLFGVKIAGWSWTNSMLLSLQKAENYVKVVCRICFLSFKQIEPVRKKVNFVFAKKYNLTDEHKNPVSDLVCGLTKVVEGSVGKVAFRLARGFGDKVKYNSSTSWHFRKFCCIPAAMWFLLFLVGFTALLVLIIARFGPNPSTFNKNSNILVLIYLLSSVAGGLLFVSIAMLSSVISSLILSPASLHSKVDKTSASVKSHITQICNTLLIIDDINQTRTRICVPIDCLECKDGKQLLQLMEALRTSFSVKPIIVLLSADHSLISAPLDFHIVESQNVFQLPLFFSERKNKEKTKMTVRNGVLSPVHEADSVGNLLLRQKKHFDLTKWLTSDERLDLIEPMRVKRIAIIVSFSARLIRAEGKDFSWPALCCWTVLSEMWPYTATCLVSLVTTKSYEANKAIKAVYFESSVLFTSNHSSDKGTIYALQGFLNSKSFNLTVRDLKTFSKLTVNLDPKLIDFVPNFNDLPTNVLKNDYRSDSLSMTSTLSYSEVPVSNWSVDDVCHRFKAIPGLNSQNFPIYDSFIRKNNFHGLAIVSCEIDELKKELHAPFGDWCLIRKFVQESKILSAKAVSVSSIADSEPKLSSPEEKYLPKSPLSPTSNVLQGLSIGERAAYDDAFKEYLKLQNTNSISTEEIQIADMNDNALPCNIASTSQNDNESDPLINSKYDINAN